MAKSRKTESIHDRDRIIIRLPDGMRDKIAAMALANGRSMTAEVISALDQHLKSADRITQLWDFFEKNCENIEDISYIWDAVVNLEYEVERLTGAPLGGLREAKKFALKDLKEGGS